LVRLKRFAAERLVFIFGIFGPVHSGPIGPDG
jgi:hypothetical protein